MCVCVCVCRLVLAHCRHCRHVNFNFRFPLHCHCHRYRHRHRHRHHHCHRHRSHCRALSCPVPHVCLSRVLNTRFLCPLSIVLYVAYVVINEIQLQLHLSAAAQHVSTFDSIIMRNDDFAVNLSANSRIPRRIPLGYSLQLRVFPLLDGKTMKKMKRSRAQQGCFTFSMNMKIKKKNR